MTEPDLRTEADASAVAASPADDAADHAAASSVLSGASWGPSPPRDTSGAAWDEADALAATTPSPTAEPPSASRPVDPEAAADAGPRHPASFGVVESARYRVAGELGLGGMGVVRSAHDRRLGRDVAFKRIAAHARGQGGVAERFVREARITAFLEHPAIVPVYDAGHTAEGEPYYTMRLVRGRTLTDAVGEADTLAARLRLLRYFLGACEAVAYAHRRGVVHRDLKPDNVLVGEFGETQVVDWGLARWISDEVSPPWAAGLAALAQVPAAELAAPDTTSVGAVVGTPAYMSPEQAAGEPVDARTDVWSLGVMLWQLIAGAHPLPGLSSHELIAAVRAQPLPPVEATCPEAPAELVAIVRRATESDPADRYSDAKHLAEDVSRFLDGGLVHAHAYSPWEQLRRVLRAWRAPLTVAAVALLVLVVGVGIAARQTREERDRAVDAKRQAGEARAAAETHLAQALVQQAQGALDLDARAEAEIFAVSALARVESPEARGVLAGFGAAPRPRLVKRHQLPSCVDLKPTPRGDRFLCRTLDAVSLWRVTATGVARSWETPLHAQHVVLVPDAGVVLAEQEHHRYVRLDAATGHILPAYVPQQALGGLHWQAATASSLAFSGVPGTSSVIDPVSQRISHFKPCQDRQPLTVAGLSPSGDRVATVCTDGTLRLTDVASGRSRVILHTNLGTTHHGATALAWLPDGAQLVVGARSGEVTIFDVAQPHLRLSRMTGVGQISAVRPHGKLVAILGERGGVLLWHAESGAVLGRLPGGWTHTLRFSPDGRELWTYGHELRRWLLPVAARPLRFWAGEERSGLSAAALSPDGAQLALLPGSGELYVYRTSDGQELVRDRFQALVLKGGAFSADGSRFVAHAMGRPHARVYDTRTWSPTLTINNGARKRFERMANGWFVAASYASGLRAVRPDGKSELAEEVAPGIVVDTAVTADRRTVYTLTQTGDVWRVDEGAPPTAHHLFNDRAARRVGVSADGAWLAVARLRDVQIHSLAKPGTPMTLPTEGDRIFDVALSPHGRLVAIGELRRVARVWRVRDGRLLAKLRGHEGRVSHVSFDATGRLLLTGSWDGSARLWDMTVLERPAAALGREVRSAWGLTLRDALDAPLR